MIYDPDYARAFTMIRCVAWQYGYAACLHGSFTRDLDVLLAPWTDQAGSPDTVIKLIAQYLEMTIQHGSPSDKPHGRKAWTLLFHKSGFSDPRWIDISVMPRVHTEAPKEGAKQ
jgi:hypothetical protein